MKNKNIFKAPLSFLKDDMEGGAKKKLAPVIISTVLCIFLAVGTVALAFANTDTVVNIFSPSRVDCRVTEYFDGKEKTDVKVMNTGDTDAYIRCAVAVTWMSEDGKSVTAKKPVEGVDYTVVYAGEDSDWSLGADGFWYHREAVEPTLSTDTLIVSAASVEGAEIPEGFYLSVEVVASAIQSTPASVVCEKWESGVSAVDENGLLEIIK